MLLEDSAINNIPSLNLLLNVITINIKMNKRLQIEVIRTLLELFLTKLLPNRKFSFLEQNPVLISKLESGSVEDRLILLFYFEECVKQRYLIFVKALVEHSMDNLEYVKELIIKTAYILLINTNEEEFHLITLIVN